MERTEITAEERNLVLDYIDDVIGKLYNHTKQEGENSSSYEGLMDACRFLDSARDAIENGYEP